MSRNTMEQLARTEHKAKNHPLRHQLADRLRLLRKVREWSQGQVADASGLHRTYISLVERGQCNISIDNLERLADAFGVEAADLIGPADSTPSAEYA